MSEPQQGQIVRRDKTQAEIDAVQSAQPTAAPLTAPAEDTYRIGFEGMATEPFPQSAITILREPIDPDDVEIKPDGIVYLPGVFYRSRLSRAFGPGAWSMPPRGPARRMPKSGGELVIFHGALYILGRFVSERYGQCMYYPSNAGMTYADAYEGAITDCLSRCCKDIIEAIAPLWEKGWRDEWQRKYAETYQNERTGKTEWRRKSSLRTSKLSPSATQPTPTASRGAGTAATVSIAAGGPSQSPPSAPSANASESTASGDDGEVADDALLDRLEKIAFEECKLPHDFAGRWLFTEFGTRNPASLTKAQALRAIAMLPTVKVS